MATLFVFYMGQTFLNINHHQETTASILFYAHLPIFAGINIFTVGIGFLAESHHANIGFMLFLAGIISFYLGVLATSRYNKDLYRFDLKAWLHYLNRFYTNDFTEIPSHFLSFDFSPAKSAYDAHQYG